MEEYDLRSSDPSASPELRVGLDRKRARSEDSRSASLLEEAVAEEELDETAAVIRWVS